MQAQTTAPLTNYNASWKEALTQYFEPFLELCFPAVHAVIDWSQPPESLDKELEQIAKDIRQLFRLVDWMMTLPKELQQRFETQVTQYQEERKMPLLSHMELRAEKRGEQRGEERGKQIGLELGSLQTARESVLDNLNVRFGEVPSELADAIAELEDLLLLKKLHRQAILVESVEAFQQFLSTDKME